MMVDDAHASGVFGTQRPRHRRSLRHARPRRHPGRHAVEGDRRARRLRRRHRALIEFLYHRARPFLFSTSHPPAVAAACIAALDVLETEPQLIERLWDNTRFFKAGLQALGFNTGLSESPITPVIVGEGALAMKLSDRLFEEGVFAQGIAFPDRRARQGARADDRHGHPHARGAAVRARRVRARSAASSASSEADAERSRSRVTDESSAAATPDDGPFFETYTRDLTPTISSACSRATRARPTSSSRAASTRRAREAAVAPPAARARAAALPRVHDEAVAGAAR